MKRLLGILAACLMTTSPMMTPAAAQGYPEGFTTGPVFEDYGPVAEVALSQPLPADASFRHSFDITAAAEPGEVSRSLESVARFINMHVRAGVPREQVQAAVVVHGRAGYDLLHAEAYADRFEGAENANLPLLAALVEYGVPIYLCGQSAAGLGISNEDLAPGVEMALSAMTAHALLQQQGYTVNPF